VRFLIGKPPRTSTASTATRSGRRSKKWGSGAYSAMMGEGAKKRKRKKKVVKQIVYNVK
jgi:hypothetical protein